MNIQFKSRRSRLGLGTGIAGSMTALLLMGTPAHAQQSELEALRAQIEELTARLQRLEETQATTATAAKATPAVTARAPITVSGLLQVHGLGFVGQDNNFPRRADTFRLRRGEIRITAPSITPRVSGTIQIDPAKAISGRTNIGATPPQDLNIRARDNILQEIQISYLLNKTATANHSIDVGQFKIPIGYEGDLVSSGNLQTVERALFFTQRDPSGADQGYGDVRDTGAQLRGTVGPVDYRLGVFNGLGDRQNTTASSDPKAVVARLAYRPAFVQGLTVGVSGGRGNTALGAGSRRFENELLNAFAAYKRDKITFQAEYLQGETQLRGGAANSDVRGYYGSLGYLFTPKIEGVFRYDSFDSARSVANAEVRDITLGLNYYIKGSNAKIQANVVNRSGAPGSPVADLRPDRTELRTNFQVAF